MIRNKAGFYGRKRERRRGVYFVRDIFVNGQEYDAWQHSVRISAVNETVKEWRLRPRT